MLPWEDVLMKAKTVFCCGECGYESPKWMGKCPQCGTWNSFSEFTPVPESSSSARPTLRRSETRPARITEIDIDDEVRFSTGMAELDRVLGGGAVMGSFVLVGGEPGVGKSTLLLQICGSMCREHTVLYVSGEESARQLKLRANRLGVNEPELYMYAQTRVEDIIEAIEKISPELVIIDSIQTVFCSHVDNAPGSVSQIRESAQTLMRCAKERGVTIFLVGHVTKEGTLAGPKMLEHMVDCVIYFEGERHLSYRILRAAKNRYGSTDEIGVFEMRDDGLHQVPNPSEALLSGRPKGASGSCVACIMEGSRPILAEIQSIVTTATFAAPRRMVVGFDYNRAMLLMAVLEKRAGLLMGGCDAYMNVTGGLRISEPAADLPAILSIASGIRDKAIDEELVSFGEVGLTGELRTVNNAQQRVNEIRRIGFRKCILPFASQKGLIVPEGLEVYPARTVSEAIELCLAR